MTNSGTKGEYNANKRTNVRETEIIHQNNRLSR